MTKLIVGLGNPGRQYENTRHNIGFMVIDEYADKMNVKFTKEKFSGLYTECIHNGEKIILLKPQKYMNLSGEVVRDFVHYFNINIDDIMIISDDINLQLGTMRLRSSGSSGGHNGLKNIELMLQSKQYKRLRIGISNSDKIDLKDYVLGKFSQDDLKIIQDNYVKTNDILNNIFDITIDVLMNKYN